MTRLIAAGRIAGGVVLMWLLLGCAGDATGPAGYDWDGTYAVTRWQVGTVENPNLCRIEGLALGLTDNDGTLSGGVVRGGTLVCITGSTSPVADRTVAGTVGGDRAASFTFGDFVITGEFFPGGYFTGQAVLNGEIRFVGHFEMDREEP